MIEPCNDGPRHQETSELLPWYVNGTLESRERERVDGHLSACPSCREELGRCRALALAVRNAPAVADELTPDSWARLLAHIDAADARPRGWGERLRAGLAALDQQFRSTPGAMRWALATESAVVLLLVATVAWQALSPFARYHTLAGGTEEAGRSTAQIRVVFAEDIAEREIRALLQDIKGRIVGGPSPTGAYTVEVSIPTGAGDQAGRALALLRADGRVRLAEPIRSR